MDNSQATTRNKKQYRLCLHKVSHKIRSRYTLLSLFIGLEKCRTIHTFIRKKLTNQLFLLLFIFCYATHIMMIGGVEIPHRSFLWIFYVPAVIIGLIYPALYASLDVVWLIWRQFDFLYVLFNAIVCFVSALSIWGDDGLISFGFFCFFFSQLFLLLTDTYPSHLKSSIYGLACLTYQTALGIVVCFTDAGESLNDVGLRVSGVWLFNSKSQLLSSNMTFIFFVLRVVYGSLLKISHSTTYFLESQFHYEKLEEGIDAKESVELRPASLADLNVNHQNTSMKDDERVNPTTTTATEKYGMPGRAREGWMDENEEKKDESLSFEPGKVIHHQEPQQVADYSYDREIGIFEEEVIVSNQHRENLPNNQRNFFGYLFVRLLRSRSFILVVIVGHVLATTFITLRMSGIFMLSKEHGAVKLETALYSFLSVSSCIAGKISSMKVVKVILNNTRFWFMVILITSFATWYIFVFQDEEPMGAVYLFTGPMIVLLSDAFPSTTTKFTTLTTSVQAPLLLLISMFGHFKITAMHKKSQKVHILGFEVADLSDAMSSLCFSLFILYFRSSYSRLRKRYLTVLATRHWHIRDRK